MQKIIENTLSSELLTALESNMIAFWSVYGRANGNTWQATSDVVWFYTGVPVPLFNGVLSTKLKPEGLKTTFDAIQKKIDEQAAPAFWWIGPQSKPDNISALLELYGLQPAGEIPGMVIDLSSIENTLVTIPNFTIQKVSSVEMQLLWAQLAGMGSGFPAVATEALARLEVTLADDPQYKAQYRYVGFLQGTPVAVSAMVLDSGVAGIYAVATIPAVRRKGIGRMMTVTPLLEARRAGYRVGILQASPMGYPLYKEIGFREVLKHRLYIQTQGE